MPIQRININSSLESIIKGRADGGEKQFLLNYPCKKEIDYLVYFAHLLEKENIVPYVRVAFDWEYGQRARRIDLVGVDKDTILLYKKANEFNTDSNALDLIRIKNKVNEKYSNLKISTCLIYSERVEERTIQTTLHSLGLDVNYKIMI